MGLNIKNEHVHDLARQAARVTGKSQTGAIEEALERLLHAYGADPAEARIAATMDVVRGLALAYSADPGRADAEISSVEDLYDSTTGLPR
jgi:antitoxin VapB